MSRGIVLMAYNNAEIDYGQMALINALMIKKNMGEQITLITDEGTIGWLNNNHDEEIVSSAFDNIIIADHTTPATNIRNYKDSSYMVKKLQYNNTTRVDIYNLSPYDETLVIDTDFLILDDSLNKVWGSSKDFMMNKSIHAPNMSDFINTDRLCDTGIPQYWATVFYFRKSEFSEMLFGLCHHIKENYNFYKFIYKFGGSLFRNDYVFSMALHMMNGFEETNEFDLPYEQLLFTSDVDILIDVKELNKLTMLIEKENETGTYFPTRITQNVHIMNKYSINRFSEQFIKLYRVN